MAPLVVTQMMLEKNAFSSVFMMFAMVLIGVALIVIVLGEETKGKTLESIGL